MPQKTQETIIKEELITAKATVTEAKISTVTQWECWFQIIDGKDLELDRAAKDMQIKYPEYKVRFDKTAKLGPCLVMEYDPTTNPITTVTSAPLKV